MISKEMLQKLYIQERRSMQSIADEYKCSLNKVNYWIKKYNIQTRSISDAIYTLHNPNGDPFQFIKPKTIKEATLFGLGLGLYWGEGTKANKTSVRLGNTDPELIKKFILFLLTIFNISKKDLRFGLQLFSDIKKKDAVDFWTKNLQVSKEQFYKIIVTPSGSIGTYRRKSKYGVITIYYNNKKLRDLLNQLLPN